MAKFIKNDLPSKSEKELQIEILNEDILSPYYFPRQKIKCVNGKLQKCLARQFKQSLTGLLPTFRIGKVPIYSRKILIYIARNNRNLLKS